MVWQLFDRGTIKAIIPVIVPSASGAEFEWELPKELSSREHTPTTSAAKKHLRDHQSSHSIVSDLDLLNGVSKIVSSVTNDTDTQGEVTVAGVINAILRFQGVLMSDRVSMEHATERISAKVASILNSSEDDTAAIIIVNDDSSDEE